VEGQWQDLRGIGSANEGLHGRERRGELADPTSVTACHGRRCSGELRGDDADCDDHHGGNR